MVERFGGDDPDEIDPPEPRDKLTPADRLWSRVDFGDADPDDTAASLDIDPEPEPDVDYGLILEGDLDPGDNANVDSETPDRTAEPDSRVSPFSPLGRPDARYNPEHTEEEQAKLCAEGVARVTEILGRRPINHEYAGRVYFDKLDDPTKVKYPDGVRFDYEAFPQFDGHARYVAVLQDGFGPTRRSDYARARALYKEQFGELPDERGCTWHHHQDGQTLMLVPGDIHDETKHTGGWAITGKLGTRRRAEDDSGR